eukprot:6208723-Pleurochrysis_carterae.AAC.3
MTAVHERAALLDRVQIFFSGLTNCLTYFRPPNSFSPRKLSKLVYRPAKHIVVMAPDMSRRRTEKTFVVSCRQRKSREYRPTESTPM